MRNSRGWVLLVVLAVVGPALAGDVPPLVNFQGRLTDGAGTPVPDGNSQVRFRIYQVDSGDNGLPCGDPGADCVWEEVQVVTTHAGVYSALLGATNPLTVSAFDEAERYLGVKVGDDPELTPRHRIASVPYALSSASDAPDPDPGVDHPLFDDRVATHADVAANTASRHDAVDLAGAPDYLTLQDQQIVRHPIDLATDVTGDLPDAALSPNVALRDQPAGITGGWNLSWPTADPPFHSARSGYVVVPGGPFEGRKDWLQCATFNFSSGCGGTRSDPNMHAFSDQWEWTYRVNPDTYAVEKNWDFTSASGAIHRYYAFFLDTETGNASFAFYPRFGSTRSLRWLYAGNRGGEDNRLGVNTTSSVPGATLDVATYFDGPTIASLPGIRSNLTLVPQDDGPSSQLFAGLEVDVTSLHQVADAGSGSLVGVDVSVVADGSDDPGQTTGALFGSRFLMGPYDRVESGSGYGGFYQFDLRGEDHTANFLSHIYIAAPKGPPGPGTSIGQLHGIFVEDLGGYAGFGDALSVASQTTGSRGDLGNITVKGGEWDNGHHRIGSTHLWQESPGRLRVSAGAPTSAASGKAVVTGTGSATYGPAAWATASVSCDSACSSMGLTCEEGFFVGGMSSAAGCSSVTGSRVCFCT